MKKKYKLIIYICLIVAWLTVIFTFSEMDGIKSNISSKGTINKAITKAAEISNELKITNLNTESTKKFSIIEKLNAPLRKCMHASVYFVLAVIIYNFCNFLKISNKNSYILSILCVLIYASIDEFHQTFVYR